MSEAFIYCQCCRKALGVFKEIRQRMAGEGGSSQRQQTVVVRELVGGVTGRE